MSYMSPQSESISIEHGSINTSPLARFPGRNPTLPSARERFPGRNPLRPSANDLLPGLKWKRPKAALRLPIESSIRYSMSLSAMSTFRLPGRKSTLPRARERFPGRNASRPRAIDLFCSSAGNSLSEIALKTKLLKRRSYLWSCRNFHSDDMNCLNYEQRWIWAVEMSYAPLH